jgi:hypothetical protein
VEEKNMKLKNVYKILIVVVLMLSACSTKSTPASPTEAPDVATEEPTTPATGAPTATTAPTKTSEPEEETEPTPTTEPTIEPTAVPSFDGFLLEDVGFLTPESVRYDPEADVYLVANINGSPGAKDGNGFISRVSPDGELIQLKWIDGAADGVTLNAPKGMALTSAGLYVADIDAVRLFDRETGAPLNEFPVQGAVFLNDVAAGDSEVIYVSGSGSGGVYSITPEGTVGDLMPAGSVQGPNGLAVWDGVVYVTSGNGIFAIEDGTLVEAFSVPQGSLDGLVFLDGDNILVSSWSASAVYHASVGGDAAEVASGVPSPADIGFDPVRGYILIPLFDGNAIDVRRLP